MYTGQRERRQQQQPQSRRAKRREAQEAERGGQPAPRQSASSSGLVPRPADPPEGLLDIPITDRPIQSVGRKARKRREKKAEQRRIAAIDRLDRGRPEAYSHLDAAVEESLLKLDNQQARKSAARRNIEAYPQRLREAAQPSVVEVGAGEGRFSGPFSKKFGRGYVATDIATRQGDTGFLGSAPGVRTKFGVDANQLALHFAPGSLSHVVGANPFGVKKQGGASYGLQRENPQGRGKAKWLPDERFLSNVRPLLKPGGTVELYGRSNILRDQAVASVPSTGKKGTRTKDELELVAKAKQKYKGENANPYLAIDPEGLHGLAKQTGYKVNVKRAKQPSSTAVGGNPDTKHGDAERAKEGLKPFNTRFSFTPAEEGYESDEEDPRVTYDSGDESDWEG